MKNTMPEDDRDLVNFIQRHRPSPPQANPSLEIQLFETIRQQPQRERKSRTGVLWAVPGTIAMGLVLSWNSQRIFEPAPLQAQDIDAIESFLISNWEATTEYSYFSATPEVEIAEIYQLLSTVESPQVISTSSVE